MGAVLQWPRWTTACHYLPMHYLLLMAQTHHYFLCAEGWLSEMVLHISNSAVGDQPKHSQLPHLDAKYFCEVEARDCVASAGQKGARLYSVLPQ